MENPLLQDEIQDICTFRQAIISSNQKIQHQLLRKKNPIQLVSYCDCSNEKIHDNSPIECSYDDKTTDYFSERDYQSSRNINVPTSNFHDPYLTDYLNQYETNNFQFKIEQLKQRKDFNNYSQNYITPVSSRKKIPLKVSHVSEFENIHLPFKELHKKKSKDEKNFLNQTLNLNRIVYNDDFIEKNKSYASTKKPQNKNKMLDSMYNIRVSQSQRKLLRTSRKENPNLTSRKDSRSVFKNLTTQKKTDKKSVHNRVQNTDLNQISLRIKKRIHLSVVVNKSTQDSYQAVYKKELRQRAQIIDKILAQQKEKMQKRANSIRK